MKPIISQFLIYFSSALTLCAKYDAVKSEQVLEKTTAPSPIQVELKSNISEWSQKGMHVASQQSFAVTMCGEFSESMKTELNPMAQAMKKLNDNFIAMKSSLVANMSQESRYREVCSQLDLLEDRLELLQAYYKDCYDELVIRREDGTSFTSLLKYLQEFQQAIENFNNTVNRIIEQIRKLKTTSDALPIYQGLKPVKNELKIMLEAGDFLIISISSIIQKVKDMSKFFHERSFKERNLGYQKQTVKPVRAIN